MKRRRTLAPPGESTPSLHHGPISRCKRLRYILPRNGTNRTRTAALGRITGGFMKFKNLCATACCILGSAFAWGEFAIAQQQQRAAGGERAFSQPAPAKDVTSAEIPGVIKGGLKWKLVWQGPDNADGLVGSPDGGIYFAQEQPSTVGY